MMSKLIIWYGLPGSGKSTNIARCVDSCEHVFDDFMSRAVLDRPEFPFSRHFSEIITALKKSETCLISEISLCHSGFRQELRSVLAALIPQLVIEWNCLDCRTPEAVAICRDNIYYRQQVTGQKLAYAFKMIDAFAPAFSIEKGAILHPVQAARPY
jgi:hypothetical protein